MAEIKVDTFLLEQEADKLDFAINQFEPFTARFTEQTVPRLDGFQSDFIDSFRGVLTNMTDDIGPELLAEIKEYARQVRMVAEELRATDKTILEQIAGDEE